MVYVIQKFGGPKLTKRAWSQRFWASILNNMIDVVTCAAACLDSYQAFPREGSGLCPVGNHALHRTVRGRDMILAVRGTDELADWITNLRVSLVDYIAGRSRNVRMARVSSVDFTDDGMDVTWGRVHEGFERAAGELLPHAEDLITPDIKTVWLTGHSLGGAIATRVADGLADFLPMEMEIRVVTFGAPRVGDREWAYHYNRRLGDRTVHLANEADPVPWLPSWWWGYDRRPNALWFDGELWQYGITTFGWLWTLLFSRRTLGLQVMGDHSMDEYARRVSLSSFPDLQFGD